MENRRVNWGEEKDLVGEDLRSKSGFPEEGNMSHRFWVRNSEIAFGFRELTATITDENPDDFTEILRILTSLIAVCGRKLIGRGKYQGWTPKLKPQTPLKP